MTLRCSLPRPSSLSSHVARILSSPFCSAIGRFCGTHALVPFDVHRLVLLVIQHEVYDAVDGKDGQDIGEVVPNATKVQTEETTEVQSVAHGVNIS
jgi:hypothetical protein